MSGSSAVAGQLPVGGPGGEHCKSLDRRWQTCWPLGGDWSLYFLTGGLSRRKPQEEQPRSFIICEWDQTHVSAPPRSECQRVFLKGFFFFWLKGNVYLLHQFSYSVHLGLQEWNICWEGKRTCFNDILALRPTLGKVISHVLLHLNLIKCCEICIITLLSKRKVRSSEMIRPCPRLGHVVSSQ